MKAGHNFLASSDGPGDPSRTLPRHTVAAFAAGDRQAASSFPTANDHEYGETSLRQAQQYAKSIVNHADVIIEYTDVGSCGSDSSQADKHCWQVASQDLIQNSPYFRALLDPNKFSEGRQFMQQKAGHGQRSTHEVKGEAHDQSDNASGACLQHNLPTISLSRDRFLSRLEADAIELFLRILSYRSLEDDEKQRFDAELRVQPTSLVARLLETGDALNSPHVVKEALQRSKYAYGKGKISLSKFDTSLLKISEDRIRQSIFIARFLDDPHVFQVSTHALIVVGSRYWINGIESHVPSTPWGYLPDGIEEELYYRRQCVLNTITDLQAFFLRAYGALEEPHKPKPSNTTPSAAQTTVQQRQFQCRCGFGNSNACDAFHLGQMMRFFALRTKTIFIGSSLLDPDFTVDPESEDGNGQDTPEWPQPLSTAAGPPSDITSIISSLKQCPDYQLDANHTGCGVRRRFVPPLDCIERFVGDSRGLLGVDIRSWDEKKWPLASESWANRARRRASVVDVRFSKINAVHATPSGLLQPRTQEENARLLFTARRRNWEA
ncbi:hypothetical protein ALT_7707 [Aspergillus lentulus]|uniref:Uncharacterized protein n=1 Tax=Aspergillus lentulus TaxID=293939 RepID=A0AAN4TDG2_ASPLE|nr:uncharacterized protein IFM58399_06472 [Aspergillus lentulus]KAF4163896.1 hypothetical protein CNMCM6936_000178 [Aspergillus lentulus]GAQ10386.1 hypothetical protein ALT_7707 [Aspergillus lentulus]GFF42040.1 hypothetical protein IFM58399_06472 [Aspergillus lentulus]GFF73201.1 hypothetical protein IFM62136_08515 [Aspergillus lentulus]GFF88488.1 hypothetical protein IFM47457_07830 [Aspergillus lentulus]